MNLRYFWCDRHSTASSEAPETAMTQIAKFSTSTSSRSALKAALVLAGLTLMTGNASALSLRVKLACASDYYAHCSSYSPGSPEVRQCMRSVGLGLSKTCVEALAGAGEMSSGDLAKYRAASKSASAK